jgi:cell wall-associated NlpC family hydrolase
VTSKLSPALFHDLIGMPFAVGGRGPAEYDCFGILYEVSRRQGINLPDYPSTDSAHQNARQALEAMQQGWLHVSEPRPGDAVLFRGGHVGVFLGQQWFLHSSEQVGCAVLEKLNSPLWRVQVEGFYRWADA